MAANCIFEMCGPEQAGKSNGKSPVEAREKRCGTGSSRRLFAGKKEAGTEKALKFLSFKTLYFKIKDLSID
jgi:hypothetical protein